MSDLWHSGWSCCNNVITHGNRRTRLCAVPLPASARRLNVLLLLACGHAGPVSYVADGCRPCGLNCCPLPHCSHCRSPPPSAPPPLSGEVYHPLATHTHDLELPSYCDWNACFIYYEICVRNNNNYYSFKV